MNQVTDSGPILFLWQSDAAVVMGKNQNPWQECRLDLMKEEGIHLARRSSGGGTVYHDLGNLNYCIIVDRNTYKEEQAYEMVFQALAPLGIQAEKTGKSNLSQNGLKFSGNAFCFKKGRAMHHGTLLLHTDLRRLNRYLGSTFEKIETNAIPSVPAKVGNLEKEMDEVIAALTNSFIHLYGEQGERIQTTLNINKDDLRPFLEKQATDEWCYQATPRFKLNYKNHSFEVQKGVITKVDGLNADRYLNTLFSETSFLMRCNVD